MSPSLTIQSLPRMTHLGNYKLVFLGDQAVGKTSIITCFMYGNFDTNYQVRLLPHLHGFHWNISFWSSLEFYHDPDLWEFAFVYWRLQLELIFCPKQCGMKIQLSVCSCGISIFWFFLLFLSCKCISLINLLALRNLQSFTSDTY